MTTEDLSLALGFSADEVSRAVETSAGVETVGEIHATAGEVAAARERLLKALERRAAERPESPELTVAEARTATGLSTPLADALLAEMESEAVTLTDTGVSLPTRTEYPPSWSARQSSYSKPCEPRVHNLPRRSPHQRCVCSSSAETPWSWETRSSPRARPPSRYWSG